MTEGIIQKNFRKYGLEHSTQMQELIEEIGLDLNMIFDSESCNEAHYEKQFDLYKVGKAVRNALIGDTTI